jgi:hypothetical protein
MVSTAPTLTVGDFSGGICELGDADYYRIAATGAWQIDLTFSHAAGDIDIYQLDPDNPTGAPLGGSDSVDDNESLTGTGPALVAVVGYPRATCTNTYSLSYTEL